jgi:F-type H+-transporting ATPase subunit delta
MINVLVNNKRASILAEVSKSYIELYQEQQGVKDVTVITAISLTDAMEKKVMAKVKELTGSDSVNLKNIIDPKILGGFVLRIGDVQYNASIANQLGNLKREFSKA